MAEEAERVGGISIGVDVDESGLDAELNQIKAKIEAFAKSVSATIPIGAGGAAGAAARQAQPQQAAITFGPKAAGFRGTPIEQAINAQLAKEGKQLVDGVVVALDTAQKQTSSNLARAVSGPTSSAAVEIQLDPTEFKAQFAEFLTELKAMMSQASEAATVKVSAPKASAGGGDAGEQERALRELSYEAEKAQGPASLGSTFAQAGKRRRSRTDQAPGPDPLADIRQQRARERAERNAGFRQQSNDEKTARTALHADQARDEEVFAKSRGTNEEARERRLQTRIETQRANITASARTSRTAASGISALFGGTQGRLIEANARLAASERAVVEAQRAGEPFRRRIAEYDEDIISSSGRVAAARRKSRDAFVADPKTQGALERETAALKNQQSALQDIQKLQSGRSIAQNLAAVTAGGAAFGIALTAASAGIRVIVDAGRELIDIQTGFQSTSTRVTASLAAQALALHGNTVAAIDQASAQANLADQTAAYLETTLKLPVAIKQGAQAQAAASDLFRASFGKEAAPGLFGGFGGIGGGGLFAQQLGGGAGFSEQVTNDIRGFRGANKLPDALRGGPLETLGRAPGGLGDILSGVNPFGQNFGFGFKNAQGVPYGEGGPPPNQASGTKLDETTKKYLDDLNASAARGRDSIGSLNKVTYDLATSADEATRGANAAASAGDDYGRQLANTAGIIVRVNGEVARSADEYRRALEQVAAGRGITDPATLARANLAAERQRQAESAASLDVIRAQQAFGRPAQIAAVQRQQQFALRVQQPAEQALSNLAQPLLPVGTGIAANADEQGRIVAGLKQSQGLQDDLNAGYAKGRQILATTYQVPLQLLTQIQGVGQQIAGLQAGISNESAAYQTAQYNFQLQIARRTLSDIGGLTGKNFGAGESYLGVLERQNLALSRQAQLIQFALAQRQINFQQAVAGFSAPGVTPEERQANVKEAQIEADYAQKQLDIQRQMFGNQVQIVDIQNLRQGADLAQQIGLLLQGRALTIDTAVAQEQIALLQTKQTQLVNQAGTYLTKVNTLTSQAFSQIQQLETAAGKAMTGIATSVLGQFGIFIQGLNSYVSGIGGISDSRSEGNQSIVGHASGYAGLTSGKTMTGVGYMGEANQEAYAILRNPRPIAGLGGLGGGTNVTVVFTGDINANQQGDLDKITRAVIAALGNRAALSGLRLGN